MTLDDRPRSHGPPRADHDAANPTRLTQVPLACRAAYAVADLVADLVADVVVNDVIAASVYEGHVPVSQASANSLRRARRDGRPYRQFFNLAGADDLVRGPDVSGP